MLRKPVLVAIVCGILASLTCNTNTKQRIVRIAYPQIIASLPMFIAEENDLFTKAGLTVKKTEFSSSNDMLNALVAGQIDALPAVSLVPLIHLEINYPGKIRLFSHSRMGRENSFDNIIVRSNSGIDSLSQLAGKKIGVYPGTSATRMLKAFLSNHKVDTNSVECIPLAPPGQLPSLSSGAINALFTYEPITTSALMAPEYKRLYGSVYADLQNPNPIGASAVSETFARDNPEVMKKFIAVIDSSVRIMRSDDKTARRILAKYMKLSPEIAEKVNFVDVTLSNETNVQNLQQFIDLLFQIGELPKKINANDLAN